MTDLMKPVLSQKSLAKAVNSFVTNIFCTIMLKDFLSDKIKDVISQVK